MSTIHQFIGRSLRELGHVRVETASGKVLMGVRLPSNQYPPVRWYLDGRPIEPDMAADVIYNRFDSGVDDCGLRVASWTA